MSYQKQVRREYRLVLKGLVGLNASQLVLKSFRLGWLTPGGEVLERLEGRRLAMRTVWQKPALLQQKWFMDLNACEKGRWLGLFWDSPAKNQLPETLKISKRRLLQLLKLRNRFRSKESEGFGSSVNESPEPTKSSRDAHDTQSPKIRSHVRIARRSVGG